MKLFLLLCMLLISAAGNAISQTSFDKIGEAVQLMDNGAIGKSIVILHEVLEKEPDSYLAQYELGYAHFLNKNYQLSIDIYKQLRNHPDCEFLVYHMLGKLYERTNDRAKAFESYQDGLKKFPDSVILLNELGNFSINEQKYDNAIAYYRAGMKSNPSYAPCYYGISYLYLNLEFPAWGIIYGEMYMALERNKTANLQTISNLMRKTYISRLATESDSIGMFADCRIFIDESLPKEEQEKAFDRLDIMAVEAPISCALETFKGDTINTEALCRFRKAYTDTIIQGGAISTTNPYVKHLIAVKTSGCENAYNHYLLLNGRPNELNKWIQSNPFEWEAFKDWFQKYKPDMGDGSFSVY